MISESMISESNPAGPSSVVATDTPGPLLDAVDRGFVARLAVRAGRPSAARVEPRRPVADPTPVGTVCRDHDRPSIAQIVDTVADPVAPAKTRDVVGGDPRSSSWPPADPGPAGPLVDRLLHAAADAWGVIARRVEDAHAAGASVVAITGARRGEGRSTVAACVARALVARGRRAEVRDRAPVDLGPGADAPIVIVDAGIWFPGGPIRRAWVESQSLGCHAAILVRQAGQPPCPARGAAIEAVGLVLLGEVLTMVPADGVAGAGDRQA